MASNTNSKSEDALPGTAPRAFNRQLRDALASLYDLPHLQLHPFAARQLESPDSTPIELAKLLQGRLLEGIEQLRPASYQGVNQERAVRRYDLMRLRYVEGLEVPEVYHQIGCSRTEYFRQLDIAVNSVAEHLRTVFTEGSAPEPGLTPLGRQSPLVGRDRELELMKAAYNAAESGDGGVIMISGEQGIGKTRLAHELGRYVQSRGGLFVEGRWAAWEGMAPYGAVAEALRRALGGLQPDDLAEVVGPYRNDLARLFPHLLEGPEALPQDVEWNPEEQQLRLYEGVGTVVHNLCQMQPMVMFLDDLHLAAQMNLQLHIARSLEENRLLIVYAFREDELSERPSLVASRNELIRARLVTDVRLLPLTEAETGRMIAHAFGESAAAQLQGPVYSVNKGNPFFIEEVLHYLVENQSVRRVDDQWEVLDTARVGIPESVRLLIQERASRLGEDASATLQQAAVMGMEFSFAALSAMSDQPEEQLVESLDQGMATGFLVDLTGSATEERYSFKEDHIREVLYERIPAARRRRYHLRAGQVLKELYPERLDELAYHFTHGSDVDKGATYSHLAAERESSLFNWTRAIPLYQDALDLWDESGGHLEERALIAEKLGDACYKFGIEARLARGFLMQALRFNEEIGDHHKIATIHSQLGREYMHSGNLGVQNLDLAMDHFDRAKEIFDREEEGIPHGMVYCGLAMASQDLLELNDATSWASKAVELGQKLNANAVIANASASFGSASAHRLIGRGRNSLERAWETSSDNGLGFQADLSRACAARALGVSLKDVKAGLGWIDRGPDYHTTYSLFDIPSHAVALHALHGDFDEANLILAELQNSLRALGQPVFGLWPDELALLWIREGALDRAEARLLEAVEWASESKNRMVQASTMQKLGEVYLAADQSEKAAPYLDQALVSFRESGSVVSEIGLLLHICEAYIKSGRLEQADAELSRVLALAGDVDAWEGLKGDLFLAQGMVTASSNRWDEAEAAFTSAIKVNQEYGLPWDEARVNYEWAIAIIENGDEGELSEKSSDLLRKALTLWESMGATNFANKCRARLS